MKDGLPPHARENNPEETEWSNALQEARDFGLEDLPTFSIPELEEERQAAITFVKEPSPESAQILLRATPRYLSKPYLIEAIEKWQEEALDYKSIVEKWEKAIRNRKVAKKLTLPNSLSPEHFSTAQILMHMWIDEARVLSERAEEALRIVGDALSLPKRRGPPQEPIDQDFVISIYYSAKGMITQIKNLSHSDRNNLLKRSEKGLPLGEDAPSDAFAKRLLVYLTKNYRPGECLIIEDTPSAVARRFTASLFKISERKFDDYRTRFLKANRPPD